MSLRHEPQADRTYLRLRTLSDPRPALAHSRSRTLLEPLAAAELIRQVLYGYDPATAQLPRVLRVMKRDTLRESTEG